ncbi:TPA: PHP domain-containing protein [Candidatus Bathyarchaeota archaeon]|nr:PHP domain-containing protein [Candidatus Bathyarchaeota archaeon]
MARRPGLKLDLHVHTVYSYDGFLTPRELVSTARRIGLDGVAITDHDSVEAHRRIRQDKGIVIIPGIEVSSAGGHILGLNVSCDIPPGLSAEETIERIHDAGGIAIASHPNSPFFFWKDSFMGKRIARLKFDAVEVVNSAIFPFYALTRLNRRLARALNLPTTGGSDSHFASTVGRAYTIVEAHSSDIDDLIQAILSNKSTAFGLPRTVVERTRAAMYRMFLV